MNSTIDHPLIWIYVTNIESQKNLNIVAKILNQVSAVTKWTVDTDDIDNVLRIETPSLKENYVPTLLATYQFKCVVMNY